MILGRYRVIEEIGAGSFGRIYSAEDTKDKKFVAIKVESAKVRHPQLEDEYKVYLRFVDSTNFPQVYDYTRVGDFNILIFELLGKSIESHFQRVRKPLSLKTVLMLADQMITAVQYLHKKSIIHRDIKPENFMLGTGNNSNKVYIIDFGLSKEYRSPITLKHYEFSDGYSLIGTARYASINALKGYEQSRRDDMESLGYIWMYLLRGSLPWQGLPAKTVEQKNARILEVKQNTPLEILCQSFPSQFVEYLRDVKSLKFAEEPHYSKYRQMFRELFLRNQFPFDYKYDWQTVVRPPSTPRKPSTQPTTPRRSTRHILVTQNVNHQTPCKQLPVLSPRGEAACSPIVSTRYYNPPRTERIDRRPPHLDEQLMSIERKKVVSPRKGTAKRIRNITYRRMSLGVWADPHYVSPNQISQ